MPTKLTCPGTGLQLTVEEHTQTVKASLNSEMKAVSSLKQPWTSLPILHSQGGGIYDLGYNGLG